MIAPLPHNADQRQRPGGWRARPSLVVLLLLPFLLGAEESFEERRQRILGMTAVERAALEHNFEVYRALPEAERRKYQQLDAELRNDTQGLQRILENYAEWLKSLSLEKREELRAASDVTTRMQIVRRYLEEQERERQAPVPSSGPLPGMAPRFPLANVRMRPDDLKPLAAILERRAAIPPDKRREMEALSPAQRHTRVLITLMNRGGDREDGRFPDENLLRELMAALPDEAVRERFREMERPEQQRQAMMLILVRALAAEWQNEMEKNRPSEVDLQKSFRSMEERHREELLRMPREFAQRQMLWHYFEQNPDPFGDDFRDFRRLMQRSQGKEGNRPPPDRRGPPPGRPGEDREGPGDRPPPPFGERGPGRPPEDRPSGERRGPRGEGPPGERLPRRERGEGPVEPRPDDPRPPKPDKF